uniref:Uncharacterized protein n=1 Tax=Arundo donax TaxID=35708 RepID=A0A0A9HB37_ARUDO
MIKYAFVRKKLTCFAQLSSFLLVHLSISVICPFVEISVTI